MPRLSFAGGEVIGVVVAFDLRAMSSLRNWLSSVMRSELGSNSPF
jgi:hypothetical protein